MVKANLFTLFGTVTNERLIKLLRFSIRFSGGNGCYRRISVKRQQHVVSLNTEEAYPDETI